MTGTTYDTASMEMSAYKVANAPEIATANASISTLFSTKTTTVTTWSESNMLSAAGWVTSPDISAVIKEIVDQSTWASGNALTILLDPDASSDLEFNTYDFDTTLGAKLTITWSL